MKTFNATAAANPAPEFPVVTLRYRSCRERGNMAAKWQLREIDQLFENQAKALGFFKYIDDHHLNYKDAKTFLACIKSKSTFIIDDQRAEEQYKIVW